MCVSLLEGGLAIPNGLHMLRATISFVLASTLILRMTDIDSTERDLVLRVGLRLAGDPLKAGVSTYERHNGFQILNVLS